MYTSIKGNLKDVDFLHLLSLLIKVRHTGKLTVTFNEFEGFVFIEHGNLKFAKFGKKEGFEALLDLARLNKGEFFFEDKVTSIEQHFLEDSTKIMEKLKRELNRLKKTEEENAHKLIKLIPVLEGEISLNPLQWKVIALSQKLLTIKEIAKTLGVEVGEVLEVIKKLEKLGLLQLVNRIETKGKTEKAKEVTGKRVPSIFWKALEKELAVLVGPVAESIIEDEMESMGKNKKSFPFEKLPDLVERLSREVDNPNRRLEFQKKMLAVIKQL